MGAVGGAHLNPAVSMAFAARGNFPWKRVPAYVLAQLLGAILATLLLWALIGKQGVAGLTLPGPGISTATAMVWELVLTVGLVSTILGTASGAQQLGSLAAIGVGSYIALAGLWGSPVSGASMNPARSLGPALVLNHWTSWWAYLLGPAARRGHRRRHCSPARGPVAAAGTAVGRLGTRWVRQLGNPGALRRPRWAPPTPSGAPCRCPWPATQRRRPPTALGPASSRLRTGPPWPGRLRRIPTWAPAPPSPDSGRF